MSFTVAIDGPAASGKGTIGRAIAARFGFRHLDTGLLYRAVARRSLAGEVPEDAARALVAEELADETGLRSAEMAREASRVAAIAEVRTALLDFQRSFARRAGGAVLDGRDIGTVICPEAEVKLYVTASPEVRAARRHAELTAAGATIDLATVLSDVRERDARDMGRADAPLRPASDATLLDTSALSIEAAVSAALSAVSTRLGD